MSGTIRKEVEQFRPCTRKRSASYGWTAQDIDDYPSRENNANNDDLTVTGGTIYSPSDEERRRIIQRDLAVYPYLSCIRNDFAKRGGRILYDPPLPLQSLVNSNKNVGLVRSDDLKRFNGKLVSKSQIDLGYRYANAIKSITYSNDPVAKHSPRTWIDATRESRTEPRSFSEIDNFGSGGTISWVSGAPIVNDASNFEFVQSGSKGLSNKPCYHIKEGGFRMNNPFGASGTSSNVKYIFIACSPQRVDLTEGVIFSATGVGARFLCHFPWQDGVHTYFDYNTPPINNQARVNGDSIILNKNYILTCAIDYDNQFATIRINSQASISNDKGPYDSANSDYLYIGQGANLNYQQNVKIGEFIAIDQPIGMQGIREIEHYLSNKWDIPLVMPTDEFSDGDVLANNIGKILRPEEKWATDDGGLFSSEVRPLHYYRLISAEDGVGIMQLQEYWRVNNENNITFYYMIPSQSPAEYTTVKEEHYVDGKFTFAAQFNPSLDNLPQSMPCNPETQDCVALGYRKII